MKYGLVYSLNDRAGVGIAEVLRSSTHSSRITLKGFEDAYILSDLDALLVGVSCDITECEFINDLLNVEYFVMISKHFSNAGVKSFTTHHVGIPIHDLSLVADVKSFPPSNPPLAKLFLKNLARFSDEIGLHDFIVSYEVTHHGPFTISRPLTFIELGSSPNEWGFKKAQEVIAYSIINSITSDLKCTPTVGFGGNHYASIFTSRAFNNDECYGHIVPNYVLKHFKDDANTLRKLVGYAVINSSTTTVKVVLDSKVPSTAKKVVKEYCEKFGLELV
ncbi:MAG: D-aminoacyl-tRNA deacylase [Sulfolobales archaeon]